MYINYSHVYALNGNFKGKNVLLIKFMSLPLSEEVKILSLKLSLDCQRNKTIVAVLKSFNLASFAAQITDFFFKKIKCFVTCQCIGQ